MCFWYEIGVLEDVKYGDKCRFSESQNSEVLQAHSCTNLNLLPIGVLPLSFAERFTTGKIEKQYSSHATTMKFIW